MGGHSNEKERGESWTKASACAGTANCVEVTSGEVTMDGKFAYVENLAPPQDTRAMRAEQLGSIGVSPNFMIGPTP